MEVGDPPPPSSLIYCAHPPPPRELLRDYSFSKDGTSFSLFISQTPLCSECLEAGQLLSVV